MGHDHDCAPPAGEKMALIGMGGHGENHLRAMRSRKLASASFWKNQPFPPFSKLTDYLRSFPENLVRLKRPDSLGAYRARPLTRTTSEP